MIIEISKFLTYSTILFFSGVDLKPDLICAQIKYNVETIKFAQSYSGYESIESNKAIELLTEKSKILDCDKKPKIEHVQEDSPDLYCSYFKESYCPNINTFLESENVKNEEPKSEIKQKLISDMKKMKSALGECNETPGNCKPLYRYEFEKYSSTTLSDYFMFDSEKKCRDDVE